MWTGGFLPDILVFLTPLIGLVGLWYAWAAYQRLQATTTDAGAPLFARIHAGATVFLKHQARAWAGGVAVVLVAFVAPVKFHWAIPAFLSGAAVTLAACWFAVRLAGRTGAQLLAAAAEKGQGEALSLTFRGGHALGLAFLSLSVSAVGLLAWYPLFGADTPTTMSQFTDLLSAFAIGAAVTAVLTRTGGGIFAKAADSASSSVQRLGAGWHAHDARNPAVFADAVGDQANAVAGVGADLLVAHVGAIAAACLVAAHLDLDPLPPSARFYFVMFPVLLSLAGLAAGKLSARQVERHQDRTPRAALDFAARYAVGAFLFAALLLSLLLFAGSGWLWRAFLAVVLGPLVAGALAMLGLYYATGRPVGRAAEAAGFGVVPLLSQGFAAGLGSVIAPVLVIAAALFLAYGAAEVYGLALLATSALSMFNVLLSFAVCGPLADTARDVAALDGAAGDARKVADRLAALGKGLAAAGRTALVGLSVIVVIAIAGALAEATGLRAADLALTAPEVLFCLLAAAAICLVAAAQSIRAVGRTTARITDEVQRQLREIPGILDGRGAADEGVCIAVAAKASFRELIVPALVTILAPPVAGFLFGATALIGLLVGLALTALLLGLFLTHTGGLWDSARKQLEETASAKPAALDAANIATELGDRFKDAAAPAMAAWIKAAAILSLLLIGFLRAAG
jgi:K(+)-stimulated pyrophosphate-energized sodium pump